MMLAFHLLFASMAPLQTPPVITYETVAKPVRLVLADVSKTTGITLTAAPTVASEPVIVHLKDAPVKEFLQHLSDALLSHWKPREKGFVLELDSEKIRKAGDAELSFRIGQVERALKERLHEMSEQPYSPASLDAALEKYAKRITEKDVDVDEEIGYLSIPMDRLAARALAAVGSERLAKMPKNSKLRMSSTPGPGELDGGQAFAELIHMLDGEIEKWNPAVQRSRLPAEEQEKLLGHMGASTALWVELTQQYEAITARVHVDYGKGVGEDAFTTLNLPMPVYEDADDEKRPVKSHAIKLSPASAALGSEWVPESRSISADLGQRLVRPLETDPLSYGISEVLLQMANVEGKNLIAVPSDKFGYAYPMPESLEQFVKSSEEDLLYSREGKWLVVTPTKPIEARDDRRDRGELQQLFLKRMEDKMGLAEVYSRYLYSHRDAKPWTFEQSVFDFAFHEDFATDEPGSIFYGSLSDEQISRLFSKEGLGPDDLTAEQKEILKSTLLRDVYRFVDNKLVELGPGGFPSGFRVNAAELVEPVAIFFTAGRSMALSPMDFEAVKSDFQEFSQPLPSKFFQGSRRLIRIATPLALPALMVRETHRTGKEAIPLTAFPEEFRNGLEKAKAWYKLHGG